MTGMLVTTGDMLTAVLAATAGLGAFFSLLAWVADRPWHNGRHVDYEAELKLPPAGTMARFAVGQGERGAARVAGPVGAPDTVVIEPTTPRPYAIETGPLDLRQLWGDDAPVLVVDSPPSMRGTLPTPDLGVPVVRRASCGLCLDGEDPTWGPVCIWCGGTARSAS